ncbi:MAG: 50S ribosomal protein L24e [Sulfolobales archaeon]
MPKVYTCSFCGGQIEPGSGLTFVLRSGVILHFCSSKCFKNFKLRRDPKKTPWSAYYVKTK